MTSRLSVRELRARLHTTIIGHRILYYPSVPSTNDVALAQGSLGMPEGVLVLAEEQTEGRGRRGRAWLAPGGTCLLFSLLLRPPLAAHQCQRLTMACSLALAESIESHTGLAVGIKWPNDLLVKGRKIAGILTELSFEEERLAHAVVGIGVNVNLDFVDPQMAALKGQATSVAQETASPVLREALLACILNGLEARYVSLCAGWSPHEIWAARLTGVGREVVVSGSTGDLEGRAEGVDEDGALLLRLEDGRVVRILAGDVSLRPASDGSATI
jgi:BirA family biotin operon repressor/biotin-[acetyl-CoA-carboxylase] ligase